MSSPALFGSSVTRGAVKNLVEIKAGKMTMKGKMVYPDNRKGQLYIYQSEDSLIHFCWKDRSTGIVEDDLIIFPDDCEFIHVKQCKTGRVYLLRFKSSSRKFFFWLQDAKTDMDEERCKKINDILNNPPTLNSQRTSSTNPEGDLQNLLNNMSQQQLMQLFGGVGHISGLGTLLGSMNRPYNSNRMTPAVSFNPRSPSSNATPSTETSENKQENVRSTPLPYSSALLAEFGSAPVPHFPTRQLRALPTPVAPANGASPQRRAAAARWYKYSAPGQRSSLAVELSTATHRQQAPWQSKELLPSQRVTRLGTLMNKDYFFLKT
uniref:Proteasomal ubiquitin receptor ADRM1 homolog n=1 Tax=Trichogramma kaykai TaxID=54128 RepID=A0ABD2WUE9_9HYME